jgi:hypothetical protein
MDGKPQYSLRLFFVSGATSDVPNRHAHEALRLFVL